MRPLLSPEAMGRADRATIDAGTPAFVLMDRAGRAVARAVIELAGGRYGRRCVVVCGKGSNGGDGYVAARVLKREGVTVAALHVGPLDGVKGAAAEHLTALGRCGVPVRPFDAAALAHADVIVDAIFGTGFRGRAEGEAATAIEAVNQAGADVIAVDIPSGVHGATGNVEGPAVKARLTITMAAEKIGTAVSPGASFAGRVEVANIGIAIESSHAFVSEAADVAVVLPRRSLDAHKRSVGSVAVLGGSAGMSGAPILTARGAGRAGAGYVTVGCTASVDRALSEVLPETLSRVVTPDDALGPEALAEFADVIERADALALGPGLGQGDSQRALVKEALIKLDRPLVLDADGLNVLAGATEALEQRKAPTVITPHPAELARLLGVDTSEVQKDRLGIARSSAARFGCVVLLKGFRTVIAAPGGRVVVNPTGSPALATAGTGDVLTGVIAAFVAAGLDAFDAAWAGAYVHGLAGTLAGNGSLAWDVAESIPDALDLVARG